MELEDRLKYCKLCKNRSLNLDRGLICQLTHEKPRFDKFCPEFLEDEYERRNYEMNLHYDKIKIVGFSETNAYPTNDWLVRTISNFIPTSMNIKRIGYLDSWIGSIIVFVLILISLSSAPLAFEHRLILMLSVSIILIVLSFRLWKLTKESISDILHLNQTGIDTLSQGKFDWSDIVLVYVNSKSRNQCLVFELLSRPDPIMIQINKSYGGMIVLSIVAVFQKRQKEQQTN